MFLVMELFLLVRHTHSPLRVEMEDGHTQSPLVHRKAMNISSVHTTTLTLMENYTQDELRPGGVGSDVPIKVAQN